jgi:RNA polymerase sigma-70 factor (ECF subfamily)
VVQDADVDEARERIAEAYRRDGATLWRALYSFTGERAAADDALAETLARAVRNADAIREPLAWMYRVAFRLATIELRSRVEQGHDPPDESYEMPDPVPELMAALAQISPNQRLAVLLHDYADRSTADVAAVLGCSKGTVHVHLSQGRRRLRALLEGVDD